MNDLVSGCAIVFEGMREVDESFTLKRCDPKNHDPMSYVVRRRVIVDHGFGIERGYWCQSFSSDGKMESDTVWVPARDVK